MSLRPLLLRAFVFAIAFAAPLPGPGEAAAATLISTLSARPQDKVIVFSEDARRLMSVRLSDGRVTLADLPVYPVGQRWYLPLGELAHSLGMEVEVSPDEGIVEASYGAGQRTFRVSVKDCSYSVESAESTEDLPPLERDYACDHALIHAYDLYATVELVEKVFDMRIDVNSYRAEIIVDPSFPLSPRRSDGLRVRHDRTDPGYQRVDEPSSRLNGFFIDQQLSYLASSSATPPSVRKEEIRHDTVLTGELFGLESSLLLNGRREQIDRQRWTLAKHSPEGRLFGDAHAREIQLMDVTFPSLPLIGGAGLFRGALISSFPITGPQKNLSQSSSQYGIRDFNGDLAAGWEVELYQNEVLIDRRASSAGRYEFKNVPLNFGINRFRLAFYGPQGQRREEYETYSIDASFLPVGGSAYRVALADDLGANARWLVQYDRSVAKSFNVFAAATRFSPNLAVQAPTAYGLLGGRAFVNEVVIGSSAATSEGGGLAFDQVVQVPLRAATLGGGYTRLSNFLSDLYAADLTHGKPREVLRSNLTFDLFGFPTIRLTFETNRTAFEDEFRRELFISRASTVTGPIKWFNTINYEPSSENPTSGELAPQIFLGRTQTRTTFGYDNRRLKSAALELVTPIGDVTTVGLGWSEDLVGLYRKQQLNLTRELGFGKLTANASTDNRGASAIGGLFSYSVEREPRTGAWSMLAKPQALLGSVSIFVFNDLNQNGIQDAGEPPVDGAEVTLNQQDTGVKTGQDGIAIINGLPVHQPADISVSLAGDDSERSQLFPRGVRVYPRAGTMMKIDFLIESSSEIAGVVRLRTEDDANPRRGIRVRLKNAAGLVVREETTDADGFYFLTELSPGSYTISLDQTQLEGLRMHSKEPERSIVIPPAGVIDHHRDFDLEALSPEKVLKPRPKLKRRGSSKP